MRFALIDNKRKEAEHGLKGLCPGCSQPVIAKCGNQRIWHWAHRNNKICDNWWEPETEWHRSWKNNYPADWQEVFLFDEKAGVKHVADLRTIHNLVIEFQHSHIDPKERATREKFYQNMVWVVDGTRLRRDYQRFIKGKDNFHSFKQGCFYVDYIEECLPSDWIESTVPVIFDFRGIEKIDNINDMRNRLYCLFPIRVGTNAILVEIARKSFIKTTINGNWSLRVSSFMLSIMQAKREWQNQVTKQQKSIALKYASMREPQWILERGQWKRRIRL